MLQDECANPPRSHVAHAAAHMQAHNLMHSPNHMWQAQHLAAQEKYAASTQRIEEVEAVFSQAQEELTLTLI